MTAAAAGRDAGFGIVEWFRIGEHERVEASLARMAACGIHRLRTHLSWADYQSAGGAEWYGWLIPRLAREVAVLPCIHYTPPGISENGGSNGAPRHETALADFVDHILDAHGQHFEAIELWNEPNNILDWDWRADPDWMKFCKMLGAAAYWARRRGMKVVLGGPCPNDATWLRLMGERGILGVVDVVGVHGFPGTWDSQVAGWSGWGPLLDTVRRTTRPFNPKLEFWITETGYSTWRHDPYRQVESLRAALAADVERLYWYGLQDIPPHVPVQEGEYFDVRHYHFGMFSTEGQPKLVARLLAEGQLDLIPAEVTPALAIPAIAATRPVLVTGGAGFIGSNLVERLARNGEHVLVYDALARSGAEQNALWLRSTFPKLVSVAVDDVRNRLSVADAVHDASSVFHLAGQVAVTTSMVDPQADFDVNLVGTMNVLEAVRRRGANLPLVFASTNKVYGDLADVTLAERRSAYAPIDPDLLAFGIDETWPLDFHTPYGCSKGAADQYVLDYARSFDIPAAVLRMSCIYGRRQRGTEDQGWVAHFLLRALAGKPVTIYGDGKQVRDILWIDDAVDTYLGLRSNIGRMHGRAFNLGGGPANAISLRQLVDQIALLTGTAMDITFEPWRAGDQRYFVADARRVREELGLGEPLGWKQGLRDLADWFAEARGLPSILRVQEGAK